MGNHSRGSPAESHNGKLTFLKGQSSQPHHIELQPFCEKANMHSSKVFCAFEHDFEGNCLHFAT